MNTRSLWTVVVLVVLSGAVALRAFTGAGKAPLHGMPTGSGVIAQAVSNSIDERCVATLTVVDAGNSSVVLSLAAFQVDEFGLPELAQRHEVVAFGDADPISMHLASHLISARLVRDSWGASTDSSVALTVD